MTLSTDQRPQNRANFQVPIQTASPPSLQYTRSPDTLIFNAPGSWRQWGKQRVFHEYVRDHKIIIYEQKAAGRSMQFGVWSLECGVWSMEAYLISGISKCAHMEDARCRDGDADADGTTDPTTRQRWQRLERFWSAARVNFLEWVSKGKKLALDPCTERKYQLTWKFHIFRIHNIMSICSYMLRFNEMTLLNALLPPFSHNFLSVSRSLFQNRLSWGWLLLLLFRLLFLFPGKTPRALVAGKLVTWTIFSYLFRLGLDWHW